MFQFEAIVLSLGTTEKSLAPSLYTSGYWYTLMGSPPGAAPAPGSAVPAPSAFPHRRGAPGPSSSWWPFAGLAPSSMRVSRWYWGARGCALYSSCGLARAGWRGRVGCWCTGGMEGWEGDFSQCVTLSVGNLISYYLWFAVLSIALRQLFQLIDVAAA